MNVVALEEVQLVLADLLCGENQHRHMRGDLRVAERFQYFESVHVRHHQIENHRIRYRLRDDLECLFGVVRGLHTATDCTHQILHLNDRGFVVFDQ